ncbi:helix-turn-helix domain-containing protein [Janibacter sp. Soil728]|uniref:helix-turn-helix domain-containing protein n=1 Tax=Janibacter sp. Soil728 TaxID=1736393 RepID=UPI0012E85930|nr:helix-turn-helix domain-containing protein [Janibacter sp. Soil728]
MDQQVMRAADRLREVRDELVEELAAILIERAGEATGSLPLAARHHWPTDVQDALRRFVDAVVDEDLARVCDPGGVFVALGAECARGGVAFDDLAASIRVASRVTHKHVHRELLSVPGVGLDDVLEVLDRFAEGGELVVKAARIGYEGGARQPESDEDSRTRRLGGALLHGDASAVALARACGWDDDAVIAAIITTPQDAATIRRESECVLAHYPRARDVVLFHPIAEDKLATTLRPLLAGHRCAVGPAVHMLDSVRSLDLAYRAQLIAGDEELTFADVHMLEIACSADRVVIESLRRTYLDELDDVPEDQRTMLLQTLLEWLRQWGHRPSVAEALGVHPQTVSHRINRLKDLLSDELDDPVVRAELLVVLTAMSVRRAWQVP